MKTKLINIGLINESVLNNFYITKDKKLIKEYKRILKSFPEIKEHFLFLENCENARFENMETAKKFLDESLAMIKSKYFTTKKLIWENVYNDFMKKYSKVLLKKSLTNSDKLYESIHYLIFTEKPNLKNSKKYNESYDYLLSHLTKKETINENNSEFNVSNPSLLQKIVEKKMEKILKKLSESERRALKILNEEDIEKQAVEFISLKDDVLEKLQEAQNKSLNENDKKIINEAVNKVNQIKFQPTKLEESVMEMIELL